MNIYGLAIGQAKQLASLLNMQRDMKAAESPYDQLIGKNIAIRGVTMIDIGRLVAVYPQELLILGASWIPETERWAQFLADGAYKECEPYPNGPVIIGRGPSAKRQNGRILYPGIRNERGNPKNRF